MSDEPTVYARYEKACCPIYSHILIFDYGYDDGHEEDPLEGKYTDASINDRLSIGNHRIAAVHTVSDGVIDVRIHVTYINMRPAESLEPWNHVTEFSIDVTSGHLVISDVIYYPPQELVISVYPGTHRLRVHYGDTATIFDAMNAALVQDHVETAEEIWITMWQEGYADPIVLKRCSEST